MGIEKDLSEIRIHTGRIADALEGLLAEHGHVPTSPTTVEPQEDLDLEPETKPAKKKSKKKAAKKKVVGKETVQESKYTLKDVRAKLHELQEAESQAAVKSILKKYAASTLKQLEVQNYERVIDEIDDQLE